MKSAMTLANWGGGLAKRGSIPTRTRPAEVPDFPTFRAGALP